MGSGVLSLRLPDETKARLDKLSARTRRPASVYVREALDEYLDDLEDYYLGMQSLEQTRCTGVTYSLDEMRERLGLQD